MSASPVSASDSGRPRPVLACAVNWLGDSVMTMPALQAFCVRHPDVRLTLLAKPSLIPLWSLCGAAPSCIALEPGLAGMGRAVRAMAARRFEAAYVLPNSFRSALAPFLARVPDRVGAAGHARAWMLTRVVHHEAAMRHQALEYYRILGLPMPDAPEPARLTIPKEAAERWAERLGVVGDRTPLAALIPGAARGPSKRWPPEHFAEVGRRLAAAGARVLVLGGPDERELGRAVADGAGSGARCLAGETSLPDLAVVLSLCRVAVANDSGGMHLAAAAGARVVAVFGLTDPRRTGPLGPGHVIFRPDGAAGARDIARDSTAARSALDSIVPDSVAAAAAGMLA